MDINDNFVKKHFFVYNIYLALLYSETLVIESLLTRTNKPSICFSLTYF